MLAEGEAEPGRPGSITAPGPAEDAMKPRSRWMTLLAVPAAGATLAACSSSIPARRQTAVRTPTSAPTTAAPTTTAAPVYPLTGLPVTNVAAARRPALSVKIDNAPGSFPQVGVDDADMVAEALVEGGLTRLFATYQSHGAPQIGPIRSARPVDAALLRELGGGIFAYSGAATGEIAPAKASSTATLLSYDAGVSAFHRNGSRPTPHNVFASTSALWGAGLAAGAGNVPPPELFTYSPQPAGGVAHPVTRTYMDLSRISSATWQWAPGRGVYLRTQDGKPDMSSDGTRMSAANVVILSVPVGPSGIFDAAGNQDPYVHLVGSGTVWVLRGGQEVQGTWTRPTIAQPVALTGTAGTIPLAPGTTWLELLPRPYLPRLGG
jgi:hypothetical protein